MALTDVQKYLDFLKLILGIHDFFFFIFFHNLTGFDIISKVNKIFFLPWTAFAMVWCTIKDEIMMNELIYDKQILLQHYQQ